MKLLLRALPFLLVLLVLAASVGGAAVGFGVGEEQRRAQAAAAERRAVEDYRRTLRPVMDAVFDAVQPLRDVDDALAKPTRYRLTVRRDVLRGSGAPAALQQARTAMLRVTVPRSLTKAATQVERRLNELIRVANLLAAAGRRTPTARGEEPGMDDAYISLSLAEANWAVAVAGVYGGTEVPLASSQRWQSAGRNTQTHGGYLKQADELCAEAIGVKPPPTDPTREQYLAYFPDRIAAMRTLITKLQRLRPSTTDATQVARRITRPLQAVTSAPQRFEALVTAVRTRDLVAMDAAGLQLADAFPAMNVLANGYRDYGVRICASYFDVSPELKGGAPKKT